ncbi:MAG TPA: hypothetical protein VGI40_25025 [Pirellulaceae bacterium]|jgi:hypothetical protein
MNSFPTGRPEPTDVELLISAARDYVRPSDDLRPRVLETARTERRERRLQRQLAQMAAVVLLMITGLTVYHQPESSDRAGAFLPTVEAMSAESQVEAARFADHASWETVESFTDLRRRQAQLLRL